MKKKEDPLEEKINKNHVLAITKMKVKGLFGNFLRSAAPFSPSSEKAARRAWVRVRLLHCGEPPDAGWGCTRGLSLQCSPQGALCLVQGPQRAASMQTPDPLPSVQG